MPENKAELKLSVVLTIVSGKEAVRRCLSVLYPQINFSEAEIIVPFDKWSDEVAELVSEFPKVNFHRIEDLGLAADANISAHQHRLYDRRRAVGLNIACGSIIAMTEDHATPAQNWCEKILSLHEKPFGVIGGAIENAVDRPLNWAWYYCDFGRYGRPLKSADAEYVSDINVAYKRETIFSVQEVWRDAYQETTVHWTLRSNGEKLCVNDEMVVYQERPPMKIGDALSERVEWGRVFAETRAKKTGFWKRMAYAAGTVFLPPVLLYRVFKNMLRQKRTLRRIFSTMPPAFLLLSAWSFGEMLGYLFKESHIKTGDFKITTQSV